MFKLTLPLNTRSLGVLDPLLNDQSIITLNSLFILKIGPLHFISNAYNFRCAMLLVGNFNNNFHQVLWLCVEPIPCVFFFFFWCYFMFTSKALYPLRNPKTFLEP